MHIRPLCPIVAILAICVFSRFVAAETLQPASDAGSTSAVTRIEYGPSGFSKLVEIIRILPSQDTAETSPLLPWSATDFVFLGLLQLEVFDARPDAVVEFSVLKYPFMKVVVFPYTKSGQPVVALSSHEENPFLKVIAFDQPLFSLLDIVTILPAEEMKGQITLKRQAIVRRRVLDSLVFCLFQKDKWKDGQFSEEWLHFPLTSTFAREKSKKRFYLGIVDSFLASVFHHSNKNGKVETYFIDALGVSVFKREVSRDGTAHWDFVKALSFGKSHFSLWHSESRKEGIACSQFLRFPLIGPIWAAWQKQNEKHWGIFPRLVFWKKFPD
jgi:hypothetical protein